MPDTETLKSRLAMHCAKIEDQELISDIKEAINETNRLQSEIRSLIQEHEGVLYAIQGYRRY